MCDIQGLRLFLGFDDAMRGISMEEFAPEYACPRKRRASHSLSPLKRHKLTPASIFSQQVIVDKEDFSAKNEDVHTVGAAEETVNFQDVSSALPGKEKRNPYP